MGKQHKTIPNEPQEAPIRPEQPEVWPPDDPHLPELPQEAPLNEPTEVPQRPVEHPEINPGKTDPSVAAELYNRIA